MLETGLEALSPTQFELNSIDLYGHKSADTPAEMPFFTFFFNLQMAILSSPNCMGNRQI